jgi:protein YibB
VYAGFPTDLLDFARVYARPSAPLEVSDTLESVIVTGFFDLRRADWVGGEGVASNFRRSVDSYFGWFAHLARLKNPFVVFTEPEFAERVVALRRDCGLEARTSVVVIERLFETPTLARPLAEAASRMTPRYWRWLLHPEFPEFREPRYVVMTALKPALVHTAIRLGLAAAAQTAWIDFGYCRDDQRFDAAKPWRFDAGERLNLFCVAAPDDRPIPLVVRIGAPYMQGCHMVGPTSSWADFAAELAHAFDALIACDLVDDEQTLMLMAWRRDPGRYVLHGVTHEDWRVLFRRFNCDAPQEIVHPARAPMSLDESPFRTEIRIALKRLEWRFKRWRAKLGYP